MRSIFAIGASALALAASPALAQDEDDWTGGYIGVQGGYSSVKSDSTATLGGAWTSESAALRNEVTTNLGTKQSDGDLNFGAQIGYNFQTGGAVLGLEGEFLALNGGETISRGPIATTVFPGLSYTYRNTIDPKHMFALKAKLGASSGSTLFYAEGGWAWTKAAVGAGITSNGNYLKGGTVDRTFDGFIVGAGIEHRFGSNIGLRLSYHYADQGDKTYNTAYLPGSAFVTPPYSETINQNLRLHLVRVGINYHF